MKIILVKDVSNLGEEGDIKVVANGYARNYLLPKKMALPYNTANMNILEQKKKAIERRKAEKAEDARSLKEKLSELELVMEMPAGEKGRLFGAVTTQMIAEEVAKQNIQIEKKKIEIPESIKTVGKYKAHVKLYGGEYADVNIEVKGIEKT
jgi:large subunit ribosomal protein L9